MQTLGGLEHAIQGKFLDLTPSKIISGAIFGLKYKELDNLLQSLVIDSCLFCLGAHAQRRHTVVCWCFCHSVILSFCHSVCYRDSGSTRAIQVLKLQKWVQSHV